MKKNIEVLKTDIEQLRDEIKLKAHLGKLEVKEEFEKLEKKWKTFKSQYKPVVNEVQNTAENAGDALGIAAEELKAGYKRLKKLF